MDCVICLEACNDSEKKTLNCKHSFHKECIEEWSNLKNECPICREKINTETIIPNAEQNRTQEIINYSGRFIIYKSILTSLGYFNIILVSLTGNSLYFYVAIFNFLIVQSRLGLITSFIALYTLNSLYVSDETIYLFFVSAPLNISLIVSYIKERNTLFILDHTGGIQI
tara:strand:- start:298 stop:804 length:507 start_codon:yes stop_codon:yes gene_type:complete